MAFNVDPQQTGWFDWDPEGGGLHASIERGGLSVLPIMSTDYLSTVAAGCSVTFNADTQSVAHGVAGQTNLRVLLASTLGGYATIRVPFSGRVFGLLGYPSSSVYKWNSVEVLIDGESFRFPVCAVDPVNGQPFASAAHVRNIITNSLSEGPHTAEINIRADGVNAQQYDFYGMIVESRIGYPVMPPDRSLLCGTYTAPDTARHLFNAAFTGTTCYAMTDLVVMNTSGTAATITIDRNSVNILSKSVAANDTFIWTPGKPVAISTGLYGLTAGTGSVLTLSLFGHTSY